MKLDKKDIKILYELEKDAHQTISSIAKNLKTSQQVISYRLQQLQNKGIIGGFYTIINFAKLGYSNYRTMIQLGRITKEKYSKLINYFRKHPNVLWLAECGGKWDFIVNILAKNPFQYNNFLIEIKNKFKEIIQYSDLLLTIEGIYLGKGYLGKNEKQGLSKQYFGKEISQEKIDNLDLKILNLISENARLNSVEIGVKLNSNNNTITKRIKELKRKEIVQGFKPLIHLEKIRYEGYKALIKLYSIPKEKENEMINNLSLNKNIVSILKMIGPWNFEIEFEVENREEMINLTRKIREDFRNIIKEFEVLPLFHEHRYNFFPQSLLLDIKI